MKMKYVNLCVDIYECESTGGSEWLREDTIALKNIELQPEMPPVDLDGLMGGKRQQESISRLAQHFGAVSGAVGTEEYEDAEDRKRNIRGTYLSNQYHYSKQDFVQLRMCVNCFN